jgi:hypothetical protein
MATMTVTNFQAGQEDEALRLSALRIAEAFRSAQNYAQSGIHRSYASARAYGVYIKKPNTIIVFADKTGDANKVGVWDTGGQPNGDAQIGEAISLTVGARAFIAIDAQQGITLDGAPQDEISIGFRALTASGLVDGKSEGGMVTITLRSSQNNHTKKVTINRLTGRVDAEY